ncbi:hypothetical protein D3C73_1195540 [compost metagenome]
MIGVLVRLTSPSWDTDIYLCREVIVSVVVVNATKSSSVSSFPTRACAKVLTSAHLVREFKTYTDSMPPSS